MAKSKGSKKGNPYERKICKWLSKWFSFYVTKNNRDDIFWRTSGSGGRATQRIKSGKNTSNSCGDVCALDIEVGGPFINICNIELKKGYSNRKSDNIDLLSSIDQMQTKRKLKAPILERWLTKAMNESVQFGRIHPLIIFKRDRKASCIIMLEATYMLLFQNMKKNYYGNIAVIRTKQYWFVVLRFDDFLEWCDPRAFFRLVIRRRKTFKCERNI